MHGELLASDVDTVEVTDAPAGVVVVNTLLTLLISMISTAS